jgi:Arc/MetJ-type ribon-helix-helix transcriptional regulator
MAYQFPPNVDELVKQQLATGDYESEDEVLIDVLRLLQRQREDLAAIQKVLTIWKLAAWNLSTSSTKSSAKPRIFRRMPDNFEVVLTEKAQLETD